MCSIACNITELMIFSCIAVNEGKIGHKLENANNFTGQYGTTALAVLQQHLICPTSCPSHMRGAKGSEKSNEIMERFLQKHSKFSLATQTTNLQQLPEHF